MALNFTNRVMASIILSFVCLGSVLSAQPALEGKPLVLGHGKGLFKVDAWKGNTVSALTP